MDFYRLKRLLTLGLMFITILAMGIGYFYWRTGNFSEALWLTITIISTLGMEDVSKFTMADKNVSSILVILSVVLFTLLIANISEILMSGQLNDYFGLKKMKDKIKKMTNHYIVCGYGHIGKLIVNGLEADKQPLVVLESDNALFSELVTENKHPCIDGDACIDDVLKEAGIEIAKGIFCCLGDDATNLLIVLNARALNPKIRIVTRISNAMLETRFLRAGADQCVSPQSWGSQNMLLSMLHPTLSQMFMQFMDKTIESGTFYEVLVPDNSFVHKKTLGESGIRKASNINVIGIRKSDDNQMIINPNVSSLIESGDALICLGNRDDYNKLRKHLGL
ncbi:MAG: potassium channel protein [bacterium]